MKGGPNHTTQTWRPQDGMARELVIGRYLRPCCPAQARLQTSRTILSPWPEFLLGLSGGVGGSWTWGEIRLTSGPYFSWFWFRFRWGLPGVRQEGQDAGGGYLLYHLVLSNKKGNILSDLKIIESNII